MLSTHFWDSPRHLKLTFCSFHTNSNPDQTSNHCFCTHSLSAVSQLDNIEFSPILLTQSFRRTLHFLRLCIHVILNHQPSTHAKSPQILAQNPPESIAFIPVLLYSCCELTWRRHCFGRHDPPDADRAVFLYVNNISYHWDSAEEKSKCLLNQNSQYGTAGKKNK